MTDERIRRMRSNVNHIAKGLKCPGESGFEDTVHEFISDLSSTLSPMKEDMTADEETKDSTKFLLDKSLICRSLAITITSGIADEDFNSNHWCGLAKPKACNHVCRLILQTS